MLDPHAIDAWRALCTAHAAVSKRVQEAFAADELPPLSWFEALCAIEDNPQGPPRMSELAELLTLSRGGITKIADRLQDAGLLERVALPEDRRSLRVQLTPAGRTLLAQMKRVYEHELEQHLAALTPKRALAMTKALEDVTASTREPAAAAAA